MPVKKNQPVPEIPTTLTVPRDTAGQELRIRIEKGQVITSRNFSSEQDINDLVDDYKKWTNFNEELIRNFFTGDRILKEYKEHEYVSFSIGGGIGETLRYYQECFRRAIRELESIIERLSIIPTNISGEDTSSVEQSSLSENKKVFIVHGHDTGLQAQVARFIEKIDLIPVILGEQVNGGKTIIEKFESHSEVGFAVVLLTPDDIGAKAGSQDIKPRGRQNVILEWGYFLGKLGRNRVCALYKEVELPSDLHGLIYVQVDDSENWKLLLTKEIRGSGMSVDMNKI